MHPDLRELGAAAHAGSARPRSRGGGRRGPSRRRGSRSPRPTAPRPSPSTRCASPGGRGPTARPRPCPRPPSGPSRARSPAGPPCDRAPSIALALVEVVDVTVRERAVLGVGAHAEVDVAIDRVGGLALDQRGDQRRRSRRSSRVASGSWSGRGEAERVGVGDVVRGHLARELLGADPSGLRGVVDLVVDVGDVGDERHVVALVRQEALEPARRRRRGARCRRGCGCRPSGHTRRCPPSAGFARRRAGGSRRCGCRGAGSGHGSQPIRAGVSPGRGSQTHTWLTDFGPGHAVIWRPRDARTFPPRTPLALVEDGVPHPARALSGRAQGLRRHLPRASRRRGPHLRGPLHRARRPGAQGHQRPAGRRRHRHRRPDLAAPARRRAERASRPSATARSTRAGSSTTPCASRASSGSPTAATR